MHILKTYRTALILVGAIVIGAIIGLIFKEKASVLQPIGDLFLNMLFMIVTPLVFFCIAAAVAAVAGTKRGGHLAVSMIVVFIGTSLVAGILGLIGFRLIPILANSDVQAVMSHLGTGDPVTQGTVGQQIVGTFTTSDFANLLSRKYMLPLIVFAAFLGFVATRMGEHGASVVRFFNTGRDLMLKGMSYIMWVAPIGILCYFAATIGALGSQILQGYLKGFIVYTVIGLVYFFGVYSVYAFIAGGRSGIVAFWKNIIAPAAMSLSTCSSSACIPVSLEATRAMGVSKPVSDMTIPLGTNVHKEGSVIGGVFKIVFAFALFGKALTPGSMLAVLGVALLVGTTMVAIPVGGMVAELMILSIFGFPAAAVPILLVISTIIDPMATMLNATGQCSSAMLVNRFTHFKETAPAGAEPAVAVAA